MKDLIMIYFVIKCSFWLLLTLFIFLLFWSWYIYF